MPGGTECGGKIPVITFLESEVVLTSTEVVAVKSQRVILLCAVESK